VAKTWALNFEKVQEELPASTALLQISAFLSPDNMPFELITLGREELGTEISEFLSGEIDEITIAELFKPLTSYSLIQVDKESKTYSIHRLVQEVIRSKMDNTILKSLTKEIVAALCAAWSNNQELKNWRQCERLFPHAQAITNYAAAEKIELPEVNKLRSLVNSYWENQVLPQLHLINLF
jgi:predicted transcriptional regulator